MPSEKAGATDGGAAAERNALDRGDRKYRVTAKDGVHIDGHEGSIKKGETITLSSDGARALLLEGSIEEA